VTRKAFDALRNFRSTERTIQRIPVYKAEDISLIEPELMYYLDELTSFIKQQFRERNPKCVIHYITSGTHKAGSQHYVGRAVDCRFVGLALWEQVAVASLFPFTGIGFYPFSTPCFVHLDIKLLQDQIIRRLWFRDNTHEYVGFNDIQEVIHQLHARKPSLLDGAI